MTPHRLYVGTIGEGLFRSLDAGRTFRRACDGTFVECDVRALAVHPRTAVRPLHGHGTGSISGASMGPTTGVRSKGRSPICRCGRSTSRRGGPT